MRRLNALKRFAPLVIAIPCVIALFCVSAFAASPNATLNDTTYTVADALSAAQAGDTIYITSSGDLDALQIPADVTVVVNSGVSLNMSGTNGVRILGTLDNYGDITRSTETSSSTITAFQGSTCNIYSGNVKAVNGNGIYVQGSATLNVYGGSISGSERAISNDTGSIVNIYNGSLSATSNAPILDTASANFVNSSYSVVDGVLVVKPSFYSDVTTMVSSAVSWIGSFLNAITSNALLLAFVIVSFTGLAIGLIKRLISV